MSVRYGSVKLQVPPGFKQLLENLSREVLREQPKNIPQFAAAYFNRLLERREQGYADGLPVAERIVEKQPSPPAPALDEDAPETQATAVEQDTAPGQDEPKVTSAEKVADEELPSLDDPDAEKAATVIQARFKGYMVRKSVTEDKEEEIRRFAGVFSEETPTSSTHVDEEDGSFAKHTLMNALLEEGSRTVLGDGAEKAASSKDDQPTFEDTTDVEEEAPAADVSELEAAPVVDEAIEPEMQEEDKSGPFEQIPRDSEAQEVGEEDLNGEVEAIEAASKKVSSAEVPPEEIPKDIVETDLIKEEIVDNSLELELSSSIPQAQQTLIRTIPSAEEVPAEGNQLDHAKSTDPASLLASEVMSRARTSVQLGSSSSLPGSSSATNAGGATEASEDKKQDGEDLCDEEEQLMIKEIATMLRQSLTDSNRGSYQQVVSERELASKESSSAAESTKETVREFASAGVEPEREDEPDEERTPPLLEHMSDIIPESDDVSRVKVADMRVRKVSSTEFKILPLTESAAVENMAISSLSSDSEISKRESAVNSDLGKTSSVQLRKQSFAVDDATVGQIEETPEHKDSGLESGEKSDAVPVEALRRDSKVGEEEDLGSSEKSCENSQVLRNSLFEANERAKAELAEKLNNRLSSLVPHEVERKVSFSGSVTVRPSADLGDDLPLDVGEREDGLADECTSPNADNETADTISQDDESSDIAPRALAKRAHDSLEKLEARKIIDSVVKASEEELRRLSVIDEASRRPSADAESIEAKGNADEIALAQNDLAASALSAELRPVKENGAAGQIERSSEMEAPTEVQASVGVAASEDRRASMLASDEGKVEERTEELYIQQRKDEKSEEAPKPDDDSETTAAERAELKEKEQQPEDGVKEPTEAKTTEQPEITPDAETDTTAVKAADDALPTAETTATAEAAKDDVEAGDQSQTAEKQQVAQTEQDNADAAQEHEVSILEPTELAEKPSATEETVTQEALTATADVAVVDAIEVTEEASEELAVAKDSTVTPAEASADDAKATTDDTEKAEDNIAKSADDADKPADDVVKAADDTDKAADDTDKPEDDVAKPADDTVNAANDVAKPADDTDKVADDVAKQAVDTDKPADDVAKAADDTDKAADDTDKPEDDVAKPADDTVNAANDVAKPADDTDKVVDDVAKPAVDTDKPADDVAKAADDTDKAADDADKPAGDAEKPADNTEVPADGAELQANDDVPPNNADVPADGGDKPTDSADAAKDDVDKPVDGDNKATDDAGQPAGDPDQSPPEEKTASDAQPE